MRQKELRLALVCYGGVSLAVYMHGVTKEIWHLARASRAHLDGEELSGVAGVYRQLLEQIESEHGLRLRVMPDILTGASAGGINAVFLAQALYSGGSLEPVTDLWLKNADVSELTAPEARPVWRFAKFWTQPLADWFLKRSGNAVDESVSPETRKEVRDKVSYLVRGRWFEPPFSGERFSEMLYEALTSMGGQPGAVLLPPNHPINLLVTATDFRGHAEMLRLNSPEMVQETEHRMPIAFDGVAPIEAGQPLADPLELTLAARATASFPGAFPPLVLDEIDRLAASEGHHWANRGGFIGRIMPGHISTGTVDDVALIDGAVLVNAPFGAALKAMAGRNSQREVDRRFVYIEPRPDRSRMTHEDVENEGPAEPLGWFSTIFGSLSTIPREQPIRDDLERIEKQSQDALRLRQIVLGLRPEIDRAVEKLFGMTFFLNSPTTKRLSAWRAKAQRAAAEGAGYAFSAYAQTKYSVIIDRLAQLTLQAAPDLGLGDSSLIADSFRKELATRGLENLCDESGGASEAAISFFRAHDVGFRIRRLQLLARRLSRDWEVDPEIPDDALDIARERIYLILSLYNGSDDAMQFGEAFAAVAAHAVERPGAVLEFLERKRLPAELDQEAERLLTEALSEMPRNLRRRMLLTYLGFPFYDVATLPLLRSERLDEYNPVKVDRISPDDALSIREGGTQATLRGTEFFNFGAFFSRSYRENDYVWGRLHGAERMIDLVVSTIETDVDEALVKNAKRAAFLAIIDEELSQNRCSERMLHDLHKEIVERMG